MHPDMIIHGLWRLREETLDDAVWQTNETFRQLCQLAPEWSNWFKGYRSNKEREKGPVFLMNQVDLIRQELIKGQYRYQGKIIAEQGYYLTAVAGPEKGKMTEASLLRLRCCSRVPPPPGYNTFDLELPVKSVALNLYVPDLLCRVMLALADIWDPDWLAASDKLTKIVPRPWIGGPVLSWINYLPQRSGVVEGDLPKGWCWFAGRKDKQIFVYESGPPNPDNAKDIKAFEQLAKQIKWKVPRELCENNSD